MWFELVEVGGMLFWGIFALFSCFVIAALEFESGVWATVLTIAFAAAVVMFTNAHPTFSWFTQTTELFGIELHNWEVAGLGVIAYFALGVAWGFVKWIFYNLRHRDKFREFKSEFLLRNNIKGNDIPDDLKAKFTDKISNEYYEAHGRTIYLKNAPRALDNKATILMWMTYWPHSALWTLLNDPVKRIFNFLYRRVGRTFQKISDAMHSEMANDLIVPVTQQQQQKPKTEE